MAGESYRGIGWATIIVAAFLGVESFMPHRAPARASLDFGREFQFKALSLYNHGAEIPFLKFPPDALAKAAYPLRWRKTTSAVALNCTVAKSGFLTNCKINRADPDDAKLKAAALKLSRHFQVKSPYAYPSIILFLQFRGALDRCLEPFCFPDLIKPPPHVTKPMTR
jgi:hypothetical protein